MKHIFLRPIGTVQDLGTARVWVTEIVCGLIAVAVLILALILS